MSDLGPLLISKVKFGKTPSSHWVFHKVGDPLQGSTAEWKSGMQFKDAKPSLWEALRKFDAIAADMMDAPNEWAFDLSAIGVSITYKLSETGGGGVYLNRGLVVTCLKPLQDHNAPMVINTACLFEYEFGKEDSGQRTLPHVATLAMNRIIDEAEAYLRGEYSDSEPIQTSLLAPEVLTNFQEALTFAPGVKQVTFTSSATGEQFSTTVNEGRIVLPSIVEASPV